MALIATQQMSSAGAAVTYSSVSASDTFVPDLSGRTFLHIKNAGASTDTVTIATPGTVGPGLSIGDLSFTVANGAEKFVLLSSPTLFTTDGVATVTHSYTTSVTCAVVTV